MNNEINLAMVKGDTKKFTVQISGLTESLKSCYFSVKKQYYDDDYVFQKSLGNGITEIEPGKIRVRIAPEDTRTEDLGVYLYDLQIGIGNDIYTVMRGELKIAYEITEES